MATAELCEELSASSRHPRRSSSDWECVIEIYAINHRDHLVAFQQLNGNILYAFSGNDVMALK